MDLKAFLRRLPPLERMTFDLDDERFNMPYHSFACEGHQIRGLRENYLRVELFDRLIDQELVRHEPGIRVDVLDIGCNLGVVGNLLCRGNYLGIDEDTKILELASELHPGREFRYASLNRKRLTEVVRRGWHVTLCLSMLEYVKDKERFLIDLYKVAGRMCIVEGHSEDIKLGRDMEYDAMLRSVPWLVERLDGLTDAGLNAPPESPGRPVWVCLK